MGSFCVDCLQIDLNFWIKNMQNQPQQILPFTTKKKETKERWSERAEMVLRWNWKSRNMCNHLNGYSNREKKYYSGTRKNAGLDFWMKKWAKSNTSVALSYTHTEQWKAIIRDSSSTFGYARNWKNWLKFLLMLFFELWFSVFVFPLDFFRLKSFGRHWFLF